MLIGIVRIFHVIFFTGAQQFLWAMILRLEQQAAVASDALKETFTAISLRSQENT
jgi:hypothetical protein